MFKTIRWFLHFWLSLIGLMASLKKVDKMLEEGKIKERDEIANKTARDWARGLIDLSGCKINVVNEELIPKDQAVLFVGNHQGNFDIPILLGYLQKDKGFVAKIELKKLPMINRWMEHISCIFLDRDDPRQSVKTINEGAKLLKAGYSLVIFPEGTRSKDGELGEFKAGAMKLASKAEVPIVPVTIRGSKDIMKKGSLMIKAADVDVIIGEIVNPLDYEKDTKKITEAVRNIIEKNLKS